MLEFVKIIEICQKNEKKKKVLECVRSVCKKSFWPNQTVP